MKINFFKFFILKLLFQITMSKFDQSIYLRKVRSALSRMVIVVHDGIGNAGRVCLIGLFLRHINPYRLLNSVSILYV